MRWQNLRLVFALGFIGFLGGLGVGLLLLKVSLFEFYDFYWMSYWGGHLKVAFWPLLKPLLLLLNGFLKQLVPGSKGLASASLNAQDFVTYFWWGPQQFALKTLSFLNNSLIQRRVLLMHGVAACGVLGWFGVTLWCSFFFRRKSAQIEKKTLLEGQSLVEEKALQKLLLKTGKASSFRLTPQLCLVKDTEVEHTLFCGATRTGKTSAVVYLLDQVRTKEQRAVILDLTGELTALFFREGRDVLLNPLDERTTQWRLWDEALRPEEIESWAATLVPASGNDLFWSQAARKLLSETARLLRGDPKSSMKDIVRWACHRPLDDKALQAFYKNSAVSSLMTPSAERTTSGVRMHLANQIDSFKYLDEPVEPFSILEWMGQEEDSWLFLTALPSQREPLGPLLASWSNFAFLGLERLAPSMASRVWFVLDEFPGLGQPLSALPRMVSEGAKYGACCVLSFQNKAQLDHLYTAPLTKTILSNCNTKMVFRSPEPETAHSLSNLFGKQEFLEASESLSMGAHHMRDGVGISHQRRLQNIVSESSIMGLEKFEAFVQLPGSLPIARVKVQRTSLVPRTKAFIGREGS